MRTGVTVVLAGMIVASCAGSDDDDGPAADQTDPPVTEVAETDPADPDDGSDATDPQPTATDAAPATDQSATDSDDEQDGQEADDAEGAPDDGTTTSVPGAAPGADLPTAAPDAEPAPPTTAPGPLTVPRVSFLDVGSFSSPVDLAIRPLDPRLYVVEQGGRIVAADAESTAVVLDIGDVDTTFTSGGEQGLLGLAFHPGADLAYVDFTAGDGSTVVAEFAVDPTSGVFDPGSFRPLFSVEQPFANHNGGGIEFGPDSMLYIALGDGGSANDPLRASLDPTTPLGSILRVDPTGGDGDLPFGVPEDNPLVGVEGADERIWSWGLRNPWRFSFDAITGDLWIADVGQNAFEEIDLAPAGDDGRGAGRGLDFGWSAFEADAPFNDDQTSAAHVPPAFAYPHSDGDCSVSGGTVARASTVQDLDGWYVFGDFCTGRIRALDTTSVDIELADSGPSARIGEPTVVQLGSVPQLVAIEPGPDGDLYALSLGGTVFRLASG